MSKEKLKDPLQINSLPFIVWSIDWGRTGQGAFEKALVDTSHRSYPKEIEFLGICENFQYPVLEIKREGFQLWRLFKEDAIIEYERELQRIEHNQLLERATGLQLEERISFSKEHNRLPVKKGRNHTKQMTDHYPMKNPHRNRWWIGDRFEYTIEQPPEGKEQYKGWKIYLYVYELRGMELAMPGKMEQVPFVYVKLIEHEDLRNFADFVPFVCFSIDEKSGKGQYLRPFVDALDSWLPKGMKHSSHFSLRYLPDNEDLELCKADILHIDNLVLEVIEGYEREITRLGLDKVNNTAEIIRTIIGKNRRSRMNRVNLRVFEDKDLGLFKQWLYNEHVAKWYTEPNEWIDEIEKRHDEFNWVKHFIVEVGGLAIGFCQYYDYALGGETWHNRANVSGAYSIDYMIGEQRYLGKGFGTDIIFALEEAIKANTDAQKIIVQPQSENKVSRSTLLSAHFLYDGENDIYYKEIRKWN